MEHPPVPSLVLSCGRIATNKNRTEMLIIHCKMKKIGSLSSRGLERKTGRYRKSQRKVPRMLREHSAGHKEAEKETRPGPNGGFREACQRVACV